jgi:hypothetical protein
MAWASASNTLVVFFFFRGMFPIAAGFECCEW